MMKVAVFVDGTKVAEKALRKAVVNINKELDELYLVNVVETSFLKKLVTPQSYDKIKEEAEEKSRNMLKDYQKNLTERDGMKNVHIHLMNTSVDGPKMDVAQKFIQDNKIDVAYVGSKGRGAMKRMWSGSFSTFLLNHTDCDIYVVRKVESSTESSTAA